MTKIKSFIIFLYRQHFVRYLVVGTTTFILDFGILIFLHDKLGLNLAASTSVAYWISILFNFTLSRYWTFNAGEKESLARHVTAYFVLLILNYLFVVTFVTFASMIMYYIYAKALAVILQMAWTYPIYKKVIFTKKD